MKTFLRSLLLCLGLASCSLRAWAAEPAFRTLAMGNQSGLTQATNLVIRDQAQWAELWKRHTGSSAVSTNLPAVDFQRELVIAAAMGQKRTGGYAIRIERAETNATQLRILIMEQLPDPERMVTQALTAPFHFAAFPRSDLRAEFVVVRLEPR